MAQPPDSQSPSFGLYVTHVDGEGHFLRISGQLDQHSPLKIEAFFGAAYDSLDKTIGAVPSAAIREGDIYAAKYRNGNYFRVKIISTLSLATGLVGVNFIDFGKKENISIKTICILDNPMISQLSGQATDYYLARIIHPLGSWEEPLLLKLQRLLCYSEYQVTVEAQTQSLPIICINFNGTDLSTHLVTNGFGVAVPVFSQEILWSPTLLADQPTCAVHGPILINQNIPNPASAMPLNQNVALQYNPGYFQEMGRRFLENIKRNVANLKAPECQLQNAPLARCAPERQLQNAPLARSAPERHLQNAPLARSAPERQLQNAPLAKSAPFKWMNPLPIGTKQSVLVSYVDSCIKFYIQLSDKIDELKAVVEAVKAHCEKSCSPGQLPVGAVCCARFPNDDNWYRAIVRGTKCDKVIVAYVDYGNEQEVDVADLRTITPELLRLPAQAMKCALKGFENRPVEIAMSNQLEMIALERTFMAQVVSILSTDTMLVTLIDNTETPALDVARKMSQLSQPRISESKATTPVRKDPLDSFTSSESREDGRNEEFGQRGGSFHGRDNFEWSEPARHSDKYGAKPKRAEQGERCGPPKPRDNHEWEDDEWEEGSPLATSTPPRRNPRDRYNRFGQQDDDNQSNNRGRNFSQDRHSSFRSDNRGERRDCGDKWEGWNQKREFRDIRSERGDRNEFYWDNRSERNDRNDRGGYKSNFTPRDWSERMDSYNDKRSERSFRSQSGGDNSYCRAPYQWRSMFTQPKKLTDPLPFETPFADPSVEIGSQQEVSVTWIVSPESFHTQILSLQPKFLEMMHKIPELYEGVKPFPGHVPIGASVLARYPADGVLYRATVLAAQPFSKYIVRYVDFGNKQLVDAKDIWQMERELIELPKMAVHCSLVGVAPVEGGWKADPEIDLCFNAPRYQCIFQECVDEQYRVSLWNDGVSVADMLVEKNLAIMSESQSSDTLKDEAVDLTVIVGQQILCRVTHVDSFDKFFVQLDLEKAELVESAIANFDVAKLTPILAENLANGVHCTVRHEGTIRRAILTDVSERARVQAVLPDYGNIVTTPIHNVMTLPAELGVYKYQSLPCRLNNHSERSTALLSLDELRTRLAGNKIIIYVDDVDEATLVSTLYDSTTGQKVAIFEPDEGAYDAVLQLCAAAVFNCNFGNAYLSHIETLNEFYLQKASDGDRIALLLDELYKFYEEGTPEPLTEFEVGALCAAKCEDGNWYRAAIVSSTDEEVKVQYSDYGNSETVAKHALNKLDPKFFEPCCLALVAGFGLVASQEDAVAKLTEWTTEKEVQVTLAFGSDGWLANLHLDGVDLAVKLVNEKLAVPQVASEETPEQHKPEEEAPVGKPNPLPQGCILYISFIDSPGQWHRAEVLDSNADITTIRFLDVLDNQPGLIKAMPEGPLKDIALDAASDHFTQLVGDSSAPVDALVVLKEETAMVDAENLPELSSKEEDVLCAAKYPEEPVVDSTVEQNVKEMEVEQIEKVQDAVEQSGQIENIVEQIEEMVVEQSEKVLNVVEQSEQDKIAAVEENELVKATVAEQIEKVQDSVEQSVQGKNSAVKENEFIKEMNGHGSESNNEKSNKEPELSFKSAEDEKKPKIAE